MPDAEIRDDDGNAPRNSESYPPRKFAIDLATLVVLTITMGGVLWYAWEARKQSGLLDNSVTRQTANVQEQIADSRPRTNCR